MPSVAPCLAVAGICWVHKGTANMEYKPTFKSVLVQYLVKHMNFALMPWKDRFNLRSLHSPANAWSMTDCSNVIMRQYEDARNLWSCDVKNETRQQKVTQRSPAGHLCVGKHLGECTTNSHVHE